MQRAIRVRGRKRGVAPATISVSRSAEARDAADGPVTRVVEAPGDNVVADLLGWPAACWTGCFPSFVRTRQGYG